MGLFFGFGEFFLGLGALFFDFVAEVFLEVGGFSRARFEAVNATFGVDDFFFASEEWVGGGRDLEFDEGVFFAVGPLDGLFGGGGGFG